MARAGKIARKFKLQTNTLEDKKTFYHGTSTVKLPLIKEKGLVVGGGARVHSESMDYLLDEEWKPTSYIQNVPPRTAIDGVYLTKDIEDAMPYAWDASKDCPPQWLEICDGDWEKAAIVEVELPAGFKVGPDGFGDYMTEDQDIPPKYIKKTWTHKQLKKKYPDFPPF